MLQRSPCRPDPAGQWTKYTPPGDSRYVLKIVMLSSCLGWAAGWGPDYSVIIWRFDGSEWRRTDTPPLGGSATMFVVSDSDVWVFASAPQGAMFHWDGSGWSVTRWEGRIPYALIEFSASDVWMLAEESVPVHTVIHHWTGDAWNEVPSPQPDAGFSWLSGTSSTDLWLANLSSAEHWDGAQWHNHAPSEGVGIYSMPGPHGGWLVSGQAECYNPSHMQSFCRNSADIAHWNGSAWDHTQIGDHGLFDIQGTAPNNAWAVGTQASLSAYPNFLYLGYLDQWDGQSWKTVATLPWVTLWNLSVVGSNDVWATGNDGSIYHYRAP